MTEDGDATPCAGAGSSPITETGTFTAHQRHTSRINKKLETEEQQSAITNRKEEFVARIRWPDLSAQLFIHLGCLYGFYLMLVAAKIYTSLFGKFCF